MSFKYDFYSSVAPSRNPFRETTAAAAGTKRNDAVPYGFGLASEQLIVITDCYQTKTAAGPRLAFYVVRNTNYYSSPAPSRRLSSPRF